MTALEAARNELVRHGLPDDAVIAEVVLEAACWWLRQRAEQLRAERCEQDAVWYRRVAGDLADGAR